MLAIRSEFDQVLLPYGDTVYRHTVAAAGRSRNLVQQYVLQPTHSTNYTPDQILDAVRALEAWVETGTAPVPAAFPPGFGSPEGHGWDPNFVSPLPPFLAGGCTSAQQTVGIHLLLVMNPDGPSARRVIYKVSERRPNGNTVTGDPTTGGATFNIKLDSNSQCFAMPASGWSRLGALGFKYTDTAGAHGPVKVARIKKTSGGVFQMKAVVMGSLGTISLVPPNPGMQGDTNFAVGGGDQYCGSTAGGRINPNDARTFKTKDAPPPSGCNVPACPR